MEIPELSLDVRFKYRSEYPSENQMFWSKYYTFMIWPELKDYEDKIHFVTATSGTPPFHKRSVMGMAEEIILEYKKGIKNFIYECFSETVLVVDVQVLTGALRLVPKEIFDDITVILATGELLGEEVYHRICKIKKFPILFKTISGGLQEANIKHFCDFAKEYVPGPREKKFLCFNKVDRAHRIELLEKLLKIDLVKDSYYSFDIQRETLDDLVPDEHPEILKIKDKLPLVLNRTPERDNPVDVRLDDLVYFTNSYFSVVTETIYYNMYPRHNFHYRNVMDSSVGFFPTEKIYKCMALRHPFIVVGTQYFLKGLRDMGYRTFSPFIDESYDEVEDDFQRLDLIVKEINRLCSLPEDEMVRLTEQFKEIVDHNHNNFLHKKEFRYTKDVISLLK